jgi:hypothetical protein
VWLPQLAPETDLIIVSADPAITSARKEREIWKQTRLTSFFFGGGFSEQPIWTQVTEVVNWWPTIVREAKEAKRGTGFLLPLRSTKAKRIYEPEDPDRNVDFSGLLFQRSGYQCLMAESLH